MNISHETLANMAIWLEVDEVTTSGSIKDAIRFNVRVGDVVACREVTERDCIFAKSIADMVSRVLLDLAQRARSQFFEREQRMLSTRLSRSPATDPKNYVGFFEFDPKLLEFDPKLYVDFIDKTKAVMSVFGLSSNFIADSMMPQNAFELRSDTQTVRVINVSEDSKPLDRFTAVMQEMEMIK